MIEDRWTLRRYARLLLGAGAVCLLVAKVLQRAHKNTRDALEFHEDHHPDHDGEEIGSKDGGETDE